METYSPFYFPFITPSSKYPTVYNSKGKPVKFFFLRDMDSAHEPYGDSGEYFIYDRYNYGLEVHCYTMDEIFKPVGNPKYKFAMLVESRAIRPWTYENVLKNPSYMENFFDLIFTFDAEILSTFKNARYVPFASNYWLDLPDNYKCKDKLISMVSSNKDYCDLHKVRINIANKCKDEKLADTFGQFDGGHFVDIKIPFDGYRFNIAIENDVTPYYFTEKITNCFATQTIPIYLGATNIDEFFNPEGIIKIPVRYSDDGAASINWNEFADVLKSCTAEEYERRLSAVIDNYIRVQKFKRTEKFLYENYLMDFFNE